VPASIGIILLRSEIVRLILGSGYFGWEATIATYQTLGFFALSIVFQAIGALLARSYYALHDTITPTIYQVIGFALSCVLGFWLAPATGVGLGVPGLALAFSIGSALTMVLLYWRLRSTKSAVRAEESALPSLLTNLLIGSITLIAVVQLVKLGSATIVDLDRFWEVLLRTTLAIGAGGLAYWWMMLALGVSELGLITQVVRAKLWPTEGDRQVLAEAVSKDTDSTNL
jgi:putative peptidoglycan lipid II flippase